MRPEDWAELRRLAQELMRKETMRLSSCTGKQGFDSRPEALRTIRPRVQGIVSPYRCRVCHRYHVGSVEERRRHDRIRRINA